MLNETARRRQAYIFGGGDRGLPGRRAAWFGSGVISNAAWREESVTGSGLAREISARSPFIAAANMLQETVQQSGSAE